MVQLVCQWLLVATIIYAFFSMVKVDIEGRKAREPKGFNGFIATIIAVVITGCLYYFAGAWSLIVQ